MVERYHARVYSLSYGVLRNAEDAEEATQDAFLTLYRKIATFDESKKFFSWFYRVALNAAYSRARRRKPGATVLARGLRAALRRRRSPGSPEFAAFVDGVEDEVIAQGPRRAGGGLHRGASRAVPGRDLDGGRRRDEAGRRGRDPRDHDLPALKSRLHRARLYVRQRLARGSPSGRRRRDRAEGRAMKPRRDVLPAAHPRVPRRVRGRLDAREPTAASSRSTFRHCPPCVVFLKSYRATGRTLRMLKPRDIPKNLAEAVVRFVRARCDKKQ